jgi:hypothetical protein
VSRYAYDFSWLYCIFRRGVGANDKLMRWLNCSAVKLRSALRKIKKRWLALSFAFACQAFAAPLCNGGPYNTGGVQLRCTNSGTNILYDTVNPGGETYGRSILGVWNATGSGGSAVPDVYLLDGGRGWNQPNDGDYVSGLNNFAKAIALGNTPLAAPGAVYSISTTSPIGMQVILSHSINDTGLAVSPILAQTGWWPGTTACNYDGCPAMTLPLKAYYGVAGGDQEEISITVMGGANNYTITITGGGSTGGLKNAHAANEYLYIPKTSWPASGADVQAFLNWCGLNCGQGTWPGNQQRIHVWTASSDSHLQLYTTLMNDNTWCVVTCPTGSTWWPADGFTGGSANSPASYKIISVTNVGEPWDLVYNYANGQSGAGHAVKSVLPALLGCDIAVDTLPVGPSGETCAQFAFKASPVALLPTTTWKGILTTATGSLDSTTPCFLASVTPPASQCSPGNMYAETGTNFAFWTAATGGAGHTGDCSSNPSITGQCWPWAISAQQGNPLGSAYTGGTASVGGTAGLQ